MAMSFQRTAIEELVSGSIKQQGLIPVERWMLKQVQHDTHKKSYYS
jgi:hypothetical protein